jgi:hypothetical protein
MGHVYKLATKEVLPHLESLCVEVKPSAKRTAPWPIPNLTSLHLPELKRFTLRLHVEETIKWAYVEQLTSVVVMPRLRHCTLVYNLEIDMDIRRIFVSPLFGNDLRHVRVRFLINDTYQSDPFSSSDDDLSAVQYNEMYHECVSSA